MWIEASISREEDGVVTGCCFVAVVQKTDSAALTVHVALAVP